MAISFIFIDTISKICF